MLSPGNYLGKVYALCAKIELSIAIELSLQLKKSEGEGERVTQT